MQDVPNATPKNLFLPFSKRFCIQPPARFRVATEIAARTATRTGGPSAAADRSQAPVANQPNRTQMMRALLRLRELILNGEFAPGERMAELPLVERLGVSRSPLRLALASLEHEGLLRGLAGGGYAVREFTRSDIRDAIELRGVLEGTAARFAAERGVTRRDVSALRTINDAIEPLVHRADFESFERYVELNGRFHAKMLALAHSPILERALDGILSLPFGGSSTFVMTEAELPESRVILLIAYHHHRSLIEAVEGRQGARAESIAREHARLAMKNLEIVLRHGEVLKLLPGASLIARSDELKEPTPR
jgi:GntR family transcriptional regulator, vanillate catabolism transcriptional regulator